MFFLILKHDITIWRTTSSTVIHKVQRGQNFAIKTAEGNAKKFDHVTPLCEKFKWLKMKDYITFSFVIAIFKHRISTYPDHLPLPTVSTMTHTSTRQQHSLYAAKLLSLFKGAFFFPLIEPKDYNNK